MNMRIVRNAVAALGAALVVMGGGAGPARAAKPSAAEIDAVFSAWKTGTPGAAVAVVKDEKVVFSRGYGEASLEHGVPITPSTVFDIGSTSKQFTAACVLLLAEEGKLSVDDDVRKHLPELPVYGGPITIAHLLHHTSGLRDYTSVMGLADLPIANNYSQRYLLDTVFRQKGLSFTPGERFSYSNTGYFLLGEIVNRVSGMPMSRFAKERIFGPLGMKSTMFWDSVSIVVPHRAESYYPKEDGASGYNLSVSLMDNVGDGGIYTTVEDLAKWDANFYHNALGAKKPEFIEAMEMVGHLNDGDAIGYASGLFVGTHKGHRIVSHSGGWRGFRSQFVRFPELGLSVICLGNIGTFDASGSAFRVADLYLRGVPDGDHGRKAQAESPTNGSIPETELDRFAGRYRAAAGVIWTVTRDGATLAISSTSGLKFNARPVGPLEFESTNRRDLALLAFHLNVRGEIASVSQRIENQMETQLDRLEPGDVPEGGLDEFAGIYDSAEVGSWMRMSVSDGTLGYIAATEAARPTPMTRIAPNTFGSWGFDVVFTRDSSGKIDGFTVNMDRAKGMRYIRRPAATP